MELKDRLVELRKSYELTLRQLRDRIMAATGDDMSISYLSALERVNRTPSIETLAKIAAGYGISVQDLLGPVDLVSPAAKPPAHSPSFESFAQKRGLTATEMEELWRIEYRGSRPESEEDWDLLYSTLNAINRRRGRK
jgi:transcriptional regulator with XRE-family HTH domain